MDTEKFESKMPNLRPEQVYFKVILTYFPGSLELIEWSNIPEFSAPVKTFSLWYSPSTKSTKNGIYICLPGWQISYWKLSENFKQ